MEKKKLLFCAAIFDNFQTKMFISETTSFQGFQISTNIGHPTSGSGGKKTVKRYLKSEQTHGHTDRRTHRRTFRKYYQKRKNSKMSRNMPKLAISPLTRGLLSIGKCGFWVDQEYPKTRFF